jgi:hypothetical protein
VLESGGKHEHEVVTRSGDTDVKNRMRCEIIRGIRLKIQGRRPPKDAPDLERVQYEVIANDLEKIERAIDMVITKDVDEGGPADY